jgi:GntR family transcriptional regulator
MEFEDQKAIYLQISDWMEEQILAKKWQDRIPAIRELASDFKVNPNTVARSYTHLESQGIITTQRGVGYFVDIDATEKILKQRRQFFLKKTAPEFLRAMNLLGLSFEDIKRHENKNNEQTIKTNHYED